MVPKSCVKEARAVGKTFSKFTLFVHNSSAYHAVLSATIFTVPLQSHCWVASLP